MSHSSVISHPTALGLSPTCAIVHSSRCGNTNIPVLVMEAIDEPSCSAPMYVLMPTALSFRACAGLPRNTEIGKKAGLLQPSA